MYSLSDEIGSTYRNDAQIDSSAVVSIYGNQLKPLAKDPKIHASLRFIVILTRILAESETSALA